MSKDKELSKRPGNTAFKQQRLKAWEPILTPLPVILGFILIGIICIPIGAAIITSSNKVVEHMIRYDNNPDCALGKTCSISLSLSADMAPPVYLYYKLDNFYQNHRRYVKSRNDDQLNGIVVTDFDKLKSCEPMITSDGSTGNVSKILVPCGLIANSRFNDTISVTNSNNIKIDFKKEGIAWQSDIDKKFKNYPENGAGDIQFTNFEDEDFIVWMRTAALPDFKKLYRIYDGNQTLSGSVNIVIDNNYPVASFDGKKYVVLSTMSWIGGRNPFLGYAYIIVGIICFVQGVVFAIKHKISPRVLGSQKYLNFSK